MVMQEASALSVMQRGPARMVTLEYTYASCACRGADWTIDRIQTEVRNYIRAHAAEEGQEAEDGDALVVGCKPKIQDRVATNFNAVKEGKSYQRIQHCTEQPRVFQ